MINIYVDGGARGNPGPAAIGVYITDENNNPIASLGEKIGVATNNVAEYKAVIKALSWLFENNDFIKNKKINLFLDSRLIFSQICGLFKIKEPRLRELLFKIKELESELLAKIHYFNIPREQNKNADRLVNLVLDNKL